MSTETSPRSEPTPADLEGRVKLAVELAHEAGAIAMEFFGGEALDVQAKGDGSPVTIADTRAERLIRERLGAILPDDGILGEEEGETPGTSGYRWVLDPIDGTTSFMRGVPMFGTLIACEHGEGDARRSVVGVIHMPALRETVSAASGHGAWWHREGRDVVAARVRAEAAHLGDAIACTTSSTYFDERGSGWAFDALRARAGWIRGWSDCYAYVLVATGRVDAAVEPIVGHWDVAMVPPILEEAGGRWSDWSGRRRIGTDGIMVAGPALHAEMVEIFTAARASRGADVGAGQ